MKTSSMKDASKGFTLIELLIVVAIISLLAAILFPVFARARENARRASCASNMKQLALAMRMYTDDYDGRMFVYGQSPDAGGSSLGLLLPYIKNGDVFHCPSSGYNSTINITTTVVPQDRTHYGLPTLSGGCNSAQRTIICGNATSAQPQLIGNIPQSSLQCLIAEVARSGGSTIGKRGYNQFEATDPYSTHLAGIIDGFGAEGLPTSKSRHFDGNNYAFVDGHVKWLKKEAVAVPHTQNTAIKFYWADTD